MSLGKFPGIILTIEGPIGVGKSTILSEAQKRGTFLGRPVKCLEEYTNLEFLQLYLKNRHIYAFSFQMVVLMSRFNTHREAQYWASLGYCVLIDRGLAGDLAFALLQKRDSCFTEEQWQVYEKTFQKHIQEPLVPNCVIYLDCSNETSMKRIQKRNRPGETDCYNIQYLDDLRSCHLEAFQICSNLLGDKFCLQQFDWNTDSLNLSGEFKKSTLDTLERTIFQVLETQKAIDVIHSLDQKIQQFGQGDDQDDQYLITKSIIDDDSSDHYSMSCQIL